MEKQALTELCRALGWFPIESKNSYMLSFRQEETGRRLSVYFTTMTVTIEDKEKKQHHHKNVNPDTLEYLLTR